MELLFGSLAGVGILVYCAFVFDVAGFLARDELWLRSLMLIASGFYLVYYFVVADQPLWDALVTNGILAAVNLAMIGVVIVERSTWGMRREVADLYAMFPLLAPGQFRRLLRHASMSAAEAELDLIREGEAPARLYFVIDGPIVIEKGGRAGTLAGGSFVGEIAYFTRVPATASVRIGRGARYLEWDHAGLDRLFRRSPGLRAALVGHLNTDLARKVAGSVPLDASASS